MSRRVPDVVFKTRVRDESIGGENPFRWQDMTTDDYFAGKRVLELGCGLALPSILASRCGADATASDALSTLIPHTKANATANTCAVAASVYSSPQ